MSNSTSFKNGAAQVAGWLREMGCTPETAADPLANWALEISYPLNLPVPLRLRVANPKAMPRAVVIAVRVVPQQLQIGSFNSLDADEKKGFWHALRSQLNREFVEFAIEGVPITECPQAFYVSATGFDSDLTLESLYRKVNSVVKACMDAMAVFDEELGSAGPASGGEFAFKKLGVQ